MLIKTFLFLKLVKLCNLIILLIDWRLSLKPMSSIFDMGIASDINYLENEIEVTSSKAVGKKCPVCWKIRENACERHGNCHLSWKMKMLKK